MDEQIMIKVAKELGIPAVCLFVMTLALWKSGKWVGQEIFIPLRDRIMRFLDDLTKWNTTLGEQLTVMLKDQVKHHAWEEAGASLLHDKIDQLKDDVASLWDMETRKPDSVRSPGKTRRLPQVGD